MAVPGEGLPDLWTPRPGGTRLVGVTAAAVAIGLHGLLAVGVVVVDPRKFRPDPPIEIAIEEKLPPPEVKPPPPEDKPPPPEPRPRIVRRMPIAAPPPTPPPPSDDPPPKADDPPKKPAEEAPTLPAPKKVKDDESTLPTPKPVDVPKRRSHGEWR